MNVVINTDLIKQYLNNNEINAIVYNGIELESLVIDNEELWTAMLSDGYFIYELNADGTYSITGVKADVSGMLTVPDSFKDAAVTTIKAMNNSEITEITIPDTIVLIESNALSISPYGIIELEYPYWKVSQEASSNHTVLGSFTYSTYLSTYASSNLTKFYAPQIAASNNTDNLCVDCTVYNNNNYDLEAYVFLNTGNEDYDFGYHFTVPANGTKTEGLYYDDIPFELQTAEVYSYFTVLSDAKSSVLTVNVGWRPAEDTTT